MRVQFLHRHIRDTVIILEGGNLLQPRCPQYNLMAPWKALNGRHMTTAKCSKVVECKIWRLTEEEMR